MATAGDIELNANSNGSEDTPSPGVVSESATEKVGTEQAINETNVGIEAGSAGASLDGGDKPIDLTALECVICNKIYTDARSLSCGHAFCFTCLCTVQATEETKACFTCEQLTVPPVDGIKNLTPNSEINANVGKAMLAIGKWKVLSISDSQHNELKQYQLPGWARGVSHAYPLHINCMK